MTPERAAALVARWVRFYTRSLPAPIAERRIAEIDADLHDHIAHERARGSADGRIALSVLSRMVRGIAADASWRGHHASTQEKAMKNKKTANRTTIGIVVATAIFLSLQLVAMLITDEVAWGVFDFVLAGALLIGIGLAAQVAWRVGGTAYRLAAGVALAAVLLLIYANLALGILGETGDPADLMYAAVLAVGIFGAAVARFRPDGMARALLAMAVVQALIAVIALLAGKHEAAISSVAKIVGANAMFVALFIGSAALFRHAARRQAAADAGAGA